MKNLKRKLFKMRLMSAILASIELANVGMTSYAIKPSDAQTSTTTSESETSDETSKTESRVKTAEKMKKMSPKELLDYLEIGSTVEELERYYDDETLDKSRKDIENFKLLEEETKNKFFEYIIKLISEKKMKTTAFINLPIEIRTDLWEYVIAQKRDLKKILIDLGIDNWILDSTNIKDFVLDLSHIAKPKIAAKMFGIIHAGEDDVMAVMTFNYDDTEELNKNITIKMSQTPDISKFNYNTKTVGECTLIDYAASIGNAKAFKYLLLNGASITNDTKQFALWGENEEIIHIAEQNGSNFPLDQETIMGLVSANRDDLIEWLDMHFGEIDKRNIALACRRCGNFSMLIKTIKSNPELLSDKIFLNETFLPLIHDNNIEITKFLIDKGADVNTVSGYNYQSPALMSAVEYGAQKEMLKLLIEKGANVNATDIRGETALTAAFRHESQKEIIEFLVENGADVNATDAGGYTALINAIEYNAPQETVEFLIKNGANAYSIDNALMMSFKYKRPKEIVEFLIKSGANVNKDNGTLLISAIQNRYPKEIIELLIEKGLNVNAVDNFKYTALMYAISYGVSQEILELLIKNGANISAANEFKQTALNIALEEGNEKIAQLLIANGAKQ